MNPCWPRCGFDVSDGDADAESKPSLADLGADVLKIEPPCGSHYPHRLPTLDGVSIPFALPEREQTKRRQPRRFTQDQAQFFRFGRGRRRRHRQRTSRAVGGLRHDMRTVGCSHGHLIRCRSPISGLGPARGMAGESVMYAMSTRVVAIPGRRNPVLPGRDCVGDGGRPGGVGSSGRLLQSAALRCRRLHRLFPISTRWCWRTGIAVSGAGPEASVAGAARWHSISAGGAQMRLWTSQFN